MYSTLDLIFMGMLPGIFTGIYGILIDTIREMRIFVHIPRIFEGREMRGVGATFTLLDIKLINN